MIVLLLLLPALVAGAIRIDIVPATDTTNVSLRWSGSDSRPITEKDQEAFKLTEDAIANQLVIHGYKTPAHVHVRNASRYGHRDLTVTLTPTGATIKRHKNRTVIVSVKEFSNEFPDPLVIRRGIKEDVFEIMSSTSNNEELSVDRTIETKIDSNHISFTPTWGEEVHKILNKTISSNVEMTLQPGQKAKAILKATRALLEVEVEYEATLEGDIHCDYTFFFIPVQGQGMDIKYYLQLAKFPDSIRSKEIITVDYYYGAQVEVTDGWSP